MGNAADDSYLRAVHSAAGIAWIIGADGQNSLVRRWVGLDAPRCQHRRFGFRRHFQIEPWTNHVEVHWSTNCQMTITPVGPTEVCVALLASDASLRVQEAVSRFPEIEKRLKGAPATTTERGAISALRTQLFVPTRLTPWAILSRPSGPERSSTRTVKCRNSRARLQSCRERPSLLSALAAVGLRIRT